MAKQITAQIQYPAIGICGLSCRLCPRYYTEGESRCGGCKSEIRISAGCPFITCAIKNKGIEFCWKCDEQKTCDKWKKHRSLGKKKDSFKCYQKLEDNITYIQKNGIAQFQKQQKIKKAFLKEMLRSFNNGRLKSYFCIAATVLTIDELKEAIKKATKDSVGLEIKKKAKILQSILNEIAKKQRYYLMLRK